MSGGVESIARRHAQESQKYDREKSVEAASINALGCLFCGSWGLSVEQVTHNQHPSGSSAPPRPLLNAFRKERVMRKHNRPLSVAQGVRGLETAADLVGVSRRTLQDFLVKQNRDDLFTQSPKGTYYFTVGQIEIIRGLYFQCRSKSPSTATGRGISPAPSQANEYARAQARLKEMSRKRSGLSAKAS